MSGSGSPWIDATEEQKNLARSRLGRKVHHRTELLKVREQCNSALRASGVDEGSFIGISKLMPCGDVMEGSSQDLSINISDTEDVEDKVDEPDTGSNDSRATNRRLTYSVKKGKRKKTNIIKELADKEDRSDSDIEVLDDKTHNLKGKPVYSTKSSASDEQPEESDGNSDTVKNVLKKKQKVGKGLKRRLTRFTSEDLQSPEVSILRRQMSTQLESVMKTLDTSDSDVEKPKASRKKSVLLEFDEESKDQLEQPAGDSDSDLFASQEIKKRQSNIPEAAKENEEKEHSENEHDEEETQDITQEKPPAGSKDGQMKKENLGDRKRRAEHDDNEEVSPPKKFELFSWGFKEDTSPSPEPECRLVDKSLARKNASENCCFYTPINGNPRTYWKKISQLFDQYQVLLREAQAVVRKEQPWSWKPVVAGPHRPDTIDYMPQPLTVPAGKNTYAVRTSKDQASIMQREKEEREREQRRADRGLRRRIKPPENMSFPDDLEDFQTSSKPLPFKPRWQNAGSLPKMPNISTTKPSTSQTSFLLSGESPKKKTTIKPHILVAETQAFDVDSESDFPSVKRKMSDIPRPVIAVPETQQFDIDDVENVPAVDINKNVKPQVEKVIETDEDEDNFEIVEEKPSRGSRRGRGKPQRGRGRSVRKDDGDSKAVRGWTKLRNMEQNVYTGMDDSGEEMDDYFADNEQSKKATADNESTDHSMEKKTVEASNNVTMAKADESRVQSPANISVLKVEGQPLRNVRKGADGRYYLLQPNADGSTRKTPIKVVQNDLPTPAVRALEKDGAAVIQQPVRQKPVETSLFHGEAAGEIAPGSSTAVTHPKRARKRIITSVDSDDEETANDSNGSKRKKTVEVEEKVACPLCQEKYPISSIEVHASGCSGIVQKDVPEIAQRPTRNNAAGPADGLARRPIRHPVQVEHEEDLIEALERRDLTPASSEDEWKPNTEDKAMQVSDNDDDDDVNIIDEEEEERGEEEEDEVKKSRPVRGRGQTRGRGKNSAGQGGGRARRGERRLLEEAEARRREQQMATARQQLERRTAATSSQQRQLEAYLQGNMIKEQIEMTTPARTPTPPTPPAAAVVNTPAKTPVKPPAGPTQTCFICQADIPEKDFELHVVACVDRMEAENAAEKIRQQDAAAERTITTRRRTTHTEVQQQQQPAVDIQYAELTDDEDEPPQQQQQQEGDRRPVRKTRLERHQDVGNSTAKKDPSLDGMRLRASALGGKSPIKLKCTSNRSMATFTLPKTSDCDVITLSSPSPGASKSRTSHISRQLKISDSFPTLSKPRLDENELQSKDVSEDEDVCDLAENVKLASAGLYNAKINKQFSSVKEENDGTLSDTSASEDEEFVFNKHDIYTSSEHESDEDKSKVVLPNHSPTYSPPKNFCPISQQKNPCIDFKNQFKRAQESSGPFRGVKRKNSGAKGGYKRKRRRKSTKGKGKGKGRGGKGKSS